MNVHRATSSCSVELYKQWFTLADFLPNWDISRGFLYILFTERNSATAIAGDIIFLSLAGQVGDYTEVHTVIFSLEFFYILFAGIISKAAIVGGTGDIFSDA